MKQLFHARKRTRTPFSAATFIQRSREESSEQKAIWHNVTGAGRSHVRRVFFDVGPEDKIALEQALGTMLAERTGTL